MNIPNKIKLFFDGSCVGKNPGGIAGFAWRILDENNIELFSDHGEVCRGPNATNNVGEWAAVTNGLLFLKKQNWKGSLSIFGDSQLVIRQLNGEYAVRKETLLPYYKQSINLLQNLQWTATWVPREQNKDCDKLSRKS